MGGRMTRAVVAVVMLGFALPAHAVVKNATIIDALRRQLLSDLDPKVPPTTIDGKGLQVKVQFRIFKVIQVNVASGQLVLKVWRRMRWFDDRLAWNPEEHGGTSTVLVYPNDPSSRGPDNNLWTPHVVLYNSKAREGSLFDPGAAWVRSDGRVHWSIPGTIDVTCRFSGLVNFPNDQLSCPIEVASWSLADDVTELTFFDEPTDPEVLAKGDRGCAEMSVQSAATAMSYMEYQLNPHETECLKYTRVYPCCPDAPWTQLWIVVKIKRTSQFYMRLIQFPSIALTLLSFTAFWMDSSAVSGRIGFSASLLLSSIVLQNTASASLPKCAEWVWIDYLNLTNLIFCMVALLETAIAIYISFGGIGVVNEVGAETCDYWARRLIPALYLSVVAFIYNVNPADPYEVAFNQSTGVVDERDVKQAAAMFEGFSPKHDVNWGGALGLPILIVVVTIAQVFVCNRIARIGRPQLILRKRRANRPKEEFPERDRVSGETASATATIRRADTACVGMNITPMHLSVDKASSVA